MALSSSWGQKRWVRNTQLYSILQATIRMSFSANRTNLTPGSLYVDKLAVRHILPIDQQNNEYSTNTIFAVAVNGELEGYDPVTWFSSIGYTDPSTIQGQLVSSMTVTNLADQSTVAGLGTAGYVSSSTFVVALTSTVAGLTTTTPVSLSLFYNTLNSLADSPYNYVSSTQLASTVAGLGSARYVSTNGAGLLGAKAISTGNVTTSTVILRDTVTSAEGTLYSQGGSLFFNGLSLAATLDISVNTVRAASYVSTTTVNVEKKSTPTGLMVGGSTGNIQTSSNGGESWGTSYNVFPSGAVNKLYYARGSWYAIGSSSIARSTNGVTWTPFSFTFESPLSFAYNGVKYMVGTNTGNIYTSPDGSTWTLISTPMTIINNILYSGSQWIATGSPSIRYSVDGITWSSSTGTMPTTGLTLACNRNMVVAGGSGGSNTNRLCYSTDNGLTWTSAGVTFTGSVNSVVWNTAYFVAGGADSGGSPVKYSRDGRTWSAATGIGSGETVTSIFWTGTKTYALTSSTVYVSTDYGRTWAALAVQPTVGGTNTVITYSVEDRDDLITNNTTFYSADIPHYYNSTNQIYGSADKVIINDTLNVRVGTIGIMKGDPSVDYHLDVAGAVNASTVYVSSVQFNDVTAGGRVGVDIDGGMLRVGGVPILQSTVAGLGLAGYVSTLDLASTVAGLGSAGYVSTLDLTSTVSGLGSAGYVSTLDLTSTVAGLGEIYVSSSGLASTVTGLGEVYVSTSGLTSTITGLGSAGYVSTLDLTSTVVGLGEVYLSSAAGLVSTPNLTSTVAGLGQIYVSTMALTSTVAGLGQIYVSTMALTSTVAGLGQRYLSSIPSTISTSILIASTISTIGTISVGGDLWIGGVQNTSWYLNRWICGAPAADNSGTIYYSDDDGVTWRDVSGSKSIFTTQGGKALWNGERWVMTGSGSASRLAYSSNGLSWTDCSNSAGGSSASLFTNSCFDVAYNEQIWVACGRGNGVGVDSSGAIAYSTDGRTWTRASGIGVLTQGADNPSVNCVKWNGYMWLAGITVGKGPGSAVGYTIPSILYSYDGINWAQVSGSIGIFNQSCNTIEWNGTIWLAGGYGDVSPINSLAYSYDGFNWTGLGNSVIGDYCTSLKWNGQLFVATTFGNTFSATGSIITSPDGFTWTSRGFYFGLLGETVPPNRADGLGWNGRKWLVSGYGPKNKTMVSSRDGITWTTVTNDISGGASFNPSYSIDLEPDLQMKNFNIYAQNVPNYLTSSNQILVGASTITLNNVLTINKEAELTTIVGGVTLFGSTLRVGNANLSTNAIRFYGTTGDGALQTTSFPPYSHTVIAERVYAASESSELLLFKGNDISGPSGPDRIRHLAQAHQFDLLPTSGERHWTDGSGVPAAGISAALYIDGSGSVGFGTTRPEQKLDVSGGFIQVTRNNGAITLRPEADTSGNIIRYGGPGTNADKLLFLGPADIEYMRITQIGLGIGTNNPSFKLDVSGTCRITGACSKGSGTFDIKHPILPDKRLVHSFIEGPRCDNIYRGEVQLVDGLAIVNLDKDCVKQSDCAMTEGTFEALCANPMVYLQNNETFDRVKGTINGNKLHIICENTNSSAKINWLVIGERKDQFIKSWERTNNEGYLITEYNE
jgi:hypothetical protein